MGIFNFTDQPSVLVPCDFTSEGLPVGRMISGCLFADQKVLKVTYAFEQATEWHQQNPSI